MPDEKSDLVTIVAEQAIRARLEELARAREVIAKIVAAIGKGHGHILVNCPRHELCGTDAPACAGHAALRAAVRFVGGLSE